MPPVSAIVQVVFRTLIFLLVIFGNVLILLAVRFSKVFTSVTRHLIGHIAIADLMFGVTATATPVVFLGGWMTFEACISLLTLNSSMGSGFGICLVLFDNYLSVRGLSSQSGLTMTVHKAWIAIAVFWIVMTLLLFSYVFIAPRPTSSVVGCEIQEEFFTQTYYIVQVVLITLILVVMVVLMGMMMLIVNRSLKNLFQGEGSSVNQLKQRSMQKKAKLSRLFAIITLGYVVSWGPLTVGLAIEIFLPGYLSAATFRNFTILLPVNPLDQCGAFKDKNFRKVCARLLRCKLGQVGTTGTS